MKATGFLLTLLFRAVANAQRDEIAVGHHVIWSYRGPNIPSQLLDAIREGKVGGVIFYGENIKNAPDFPGQVKALQDAYTQSPEYPGYPLLLVTDQEGGIVNRLPGGPDMSAKQIGDSEAKARTAGQTVATVFGEYGINGDLAPVLDVYRTDGDFTDREQRSFSKDPAAVSRSAAAWIAGLQEAGYIATAKHFPGLGAAATDENTDLRPVTIDRSLDELMDIDMLPYRAAIDANVKMVMTSWAVYPALDERPAGLSRKIVQQELRERLGFRGVTITDALEAGSIKSFGSTADLAMQASAAGMDIILASVRDVKQGQDAHEGLLSALQSGQLDREEFEEATQRIVDLRGSISKQ